MKDLQINDWLQHANGKYYQVTRIDGLSDGNIHFTCGSPHLWEYNNKFKPIPLTPEIFEKNGFRKRKWESNSYVNDESEAAYICFSIGDYTNLWGGGDQDYVWVTVKYVHQLQHVLRLFEIKEEIVL